MTHPREQLADTVSPPAPSARKTAFASFIGTLIEWYDFFIFGTASALIFSKVFFTSLTPASGVLASFATFGVAFLARPVGAIVFGHYGDKIGRKKMLVTSLLMMGAGTVFVGLLPTYNTIGVWAPILLVAFRLLQGLAVGGEWGGAVLMAVEHAPKNKRVFYGSFPQMGVPAALVLATLSFLAVRQLPEDAFMSWGWRIPFIASILMIGVGLYIRLNILESPAFAKMKKTGGEEKMPIVSVVKNNWRQLLIGMGSTATANIPFYMVTVFVIKYAQDQTGVSGNFMLVALCIASLFEVVGVPLFAKLSDRIGAKPVLMGGAIFFLLYAFPFFALVNTGNEALIILALILALGLGHASVYAGSAAFLSSLFPTNVRYTGTSVSYQLGGALTSGPVPLVAASLLAWAGSSTPLATYIVIGASVSIVSLLCIRNRYSADEFVAVAPAADATVETSPVLDGPVSHKV